MFSCPASIIRFGRCNMRSVFKNQNHRLTSDSKDGVRRFFYMDVKTAVDDRSLHLVARQKAMDVWPRMGRTSGGQGCPRAGEDILKTGMNEGSPKPWVSEPFWILFWLEKSIPPPEPCTVGDRQTKKTL